MIQALARRQDTVAARPLVEPLEAKRMLDASSLDPTPLDPGELQAEHQLVHNQTLQLTDPVDGDIVTIKATFRDPNGTGMVGIGLGGEIEYIGLQNEVSKLTIKVKKVSGGDGVVNIGQLTGQGFGVDKVTAKNVRWVGGQSVMFEGGIDIGESSNLNLYELGQAAKFLVSKDATGDKPLKVKLNNVDTTNSFVVGQPIKQLKVNENLQAGDVELRQGGKNVKITGNLVGTNVEVQPNTGNPDEQMKIKVGGDVEVTNMTIDAPVNSFITGGVIGFATTIIFAEAMRKMVIGSVILGSLSVLGVLGTGKVGGDIEGSVQLYQATKFTLVGALFGSLLATYESSSASDLAIKTLVLGAMLSGSIFNTAGSVGKMTVIGAFVEAQILFGVLGSWTLLGNGFPCCGQTGVLNPVTAAVLGALIFKGKGVDYAFLGGFIIGYALTKLQMGRLGANMGGGIALASHHADDTNINVKEIGYQGPRLKGKGIAALDELSNQGGLQLAYLS
ncbi:MAG: hypothetical protein ACF8NJ_09490 [Phycisphaerales bacterium JB038]